MKAWLKSLGKADARIPRQGLAATSWVTDDIGFPVEPSVRPGDRLVLYASGYGQIFGVVEVNLGASLDNREAPWSYRVPVRARLVFDDLDRAPELEEANVPGQRNLRRSVRQQSHIRLTDGEYRAAVSALEGAADVSRGDLLIPAVGGKI